MKRLLLLLFLLWLMGASVLALWIFFNYKKFDEAELQAYFLQKLQRNLDGDVKVGEVKMVWGAEPHLELDSFSLALSEEQDTLIEASNIKIPLQVKSWRRRKVLLGPIEVGEAKVDLSRSKDGEWNWKRLADAERKVYLPEKAPPALFNFFSPKVWGVSLRHIDVNQWNIFYSDASGASRLSRAIVGCKLNIEHPTSFSLWRYRLACPQPDNFSAHGAYDIKVHTASFVVTALNDKLTVRGDILDLNSSPRLRGIIEANGVNLATSVFAYIDSHDQNNLNDSKTEDAASAEEIVGRLTAKFKGVAEGTHPDKIKETISGDGPVDIRSGKFMNYNFVKKILRKVHDTSGLDMLDPETVPEEFREVLVEDDLPFDILQGRIRVHMGRIYLSDVRVKHPHYFLEAQGNMGWFEQDADFSAKLVLYDDLSAYLSTKVPRVDVLTGDTKRIVIPFNFKGIMPGASVYPDLSLIISRLQRMLKEDAEKKAAAMGPRMPEALNTDESIEELGAVVSDLEIKEVGVHEV